MTRIVLLGLGAAAHNIHVGAIRSIDGATLVGGADPDESAREAFRKIDGGIPVVADAERLLAMARADWAIVCAPPSAHRELCLLALEHGAHVLSEKPFVETVADADAVLEAAERRERVVAVNHEFARMPVHAALLDAARNRTYGRPLVFQAWQTVQPEDPDEPGWRSSARSMEEFGTHVIDLAIQAFGHPPHAVTARMPKRDTDRGDPFDVAVLEFGDGASATVVLNRLCQGRHRYLEVRLDTEGASLRSSIGGRMSASAYFSSSMRRFGVKMDVARGGLAWIEREAGRKVLARNPGNVFQDATARHLAAVLEAVERGEEPPASGRSARDVVRIVEAAYESARTGATVDLALQEASV